MGRLIDADALLEQIKNPYTEYPVMIKIRKAIEDMINETPTVSQRVESVESVEPVAIDGERRDNEETKADKC